MLGDEFNVGDIVRVLSAEEAAYQLGIYDTIRNPDGSLKAKIGSYDGLVDGAAGSYGVITAKQEYYIRHACFNQEKSSAMRYHVDCVPSRWVRNYMICHDDRKDLPPIEIPEDLMF